MDFFNDFMMPAVFGICLCAGYTIKKWIADVDNKYIPGIVAALGVFLSIWCNGWELSPEAILSGLISGLSSTGMHQMFKQFIKDGTG